VSLEERLAAEYRAAQTMRARERGALVKFAGLYHSVSTNETMSLHRDGCRDIEREREDHASNVERFEEESITAALDHMVDEELREMGYDHESVKVHNCTKEAAVTTTTDPTAVVLPKPKRQRRKPAPVTTRHDPSIVRKPAAKSAPKNGRKVTTAKATPAKAKPVKESAPANRSKVNPPNGFKTWDDKRLAAKIVKAKQAGSTIKEIAEELGLPAEHGSWFRVSKVWRESADARGLDRPRRSK
jgi:hypothetical protein